MFPQLTKYRGRTSEDLICLRPFNLPSPRYSPRSSQLYPLQVSLTGAHSLERLLCKFPIYSELSPPWPSGYERRNPTLVPVVRARFEPRCGRPHFAPTCNGVRVCGRNRTEAREREWAEGTVSSLPGTLNFRMKFCHSTGIARSGGGVRAGTTSYA